MAEIFARMRFRKKSPGGSVACDYWSKTSHSVLLNNSKREGHWPTRYGAVEVDGEHQIKFGLLRCHKKSIHLWKLKGPCVGVADRMEDSPLKQDLGYQDNYG